MPLAAERDRIAKQLPEATLIAIQDAMENEFEEIDKLDRFADAEYPDVSEVDFEDDDDGLYGHGADEEADYSDPDFA